MLPRLHTGIEDGRLPTITKRANGVDVSRRGAFALGTTLVFSASVPRRLGISCVVLRLAKDGEPPKDFPFEFADTSLGVDTYTLSLTFDRAVCGGEDALFFYEYLFLRGRDTLFTDSVNNVDFRLTEMSMNKFRLTIYRSDYKVPSWFAGGTMYHVFVDRFYKGSVETPKRSDAVINPDWETGVPQYPAVAGGKLENNEFFGGTLYGVAEKLEYLLSLGVSVVYLSPVFKAYSNHKYDTGDYECVDEMFGGAEALEQLIKKAKDKGIRIILDGVFNHTGDDSKYFNRYGKYKSLGAYQSTASPYYGWYRFSEHPQRYEAWWDIPILPRLCGDNKDCRDYFVSEGGIVDRYLSWGIGGWRLDVADELSDEFLDELRVTAKKRSEDAIIIGEVWENAADKTAYGKRRRYFRGCQLDSVMNYPLRSAILDFVLRGDADSFYNTVTELYASYPPFVCHALMNLLGTHDTERILSVLGGAPLDSMSNTELATYRLLDHEKERAVRLLKLASVLQFTVFGVPSIYYGDEAGIQGGHDPFCRFPFPWGREESELQAHYQMLGKIRREHSVFADGDFFFVERKKHFLAYVRENERERIWVLVNADEEAVSMGLPALCVDLQDGRTYEGTISVEPKSAVILKETGGCYAEKADSENDQK
jgi:glycosidase